MAVIRTVHMPLNREPEVLFGLRLSDLVWVGASFVGDLMLWIHVSGAMVTRVGAMGCITGCGLGLGLVRLENVSLPVWTARAFLFLVRPRLYLP